MSNFLSQSGEIPQPVNPMATNPAGFGEAFAIGLETERFTESQLGLQQRFIEYEQEALDEIYKQTGERFRPLAEQGIAAGEGMFGVYRDLARHYEEGTDLPDFAKAHVERIDQLRQFNPNIFTYRDVWGKTQMEAKRQEQELQQLYARPGGFAKHMGAFAGAMVGAMSDANPINIFTGFIGGIGRTAAVRIGSEIGVVGLIEGVNQLTGVAENRRLLGLESSFSRSAYNALAAGLGAGVLRGAGEGAVAGLRRMRGISKETAPPPPPPRLDIVEGTAGTGQLTPTMRAAVNDAHTRQAVVERAPYGKDPEGIQIFARETEDLFAQENDWTLRRDEIVPPQEAVQQLTDRSAKISEEIPRVEREIEQLQTNREMAARVDEVDARISELEAELAANKDRRKTGRITRQLTEARAERAALPPEAAPEKEITEQISAKRAELRELNDTQGRIQTRLNPQPHSWPTRAEPEAKIREQLSVARTADPDGEDTTQAIVNDMEKLTDNEIAVFQRALANNADELGEVATDPAASAIDMNFKFLDPDTGQEVTARQLLEDFEASDYIIEAAKVCRLSNG